MNDRTLLQIGASLTANQRLMLALLEDAEGEVTPEIEALEVRLDDDLTALDKKAVGYGLMVKELSASADALEAEIDLLRRIQRSRRARADFLKRRLVAEMLRLGITRAGQGRGAVRIQANPASVEIVNEHEIAPDYLRTKVEVDRAAILSALKAGHEVPGARLADTTYHLRVT